MTRQFYRTYIPQSNENLCPHGDWYVNVHSSIFLTAKKWKPKCSTTDEWVTKIWPIHTWNTITKKSEVQIYAKYF